ncbi:DNA primase [Yersinia enterocolitica]|uniref:DNA primase n=1 Tax=Yersinia enterocolitica TaxID=630 RepID=UPI001F5AA304|nr:DNA primase [Yersinia enterocolitica]EKN3987775.1 DNA primase [Yersinia enterocolitica]EKN5944410.1 DNA primase [Yersinia enterocolitica]EKN6413517.1 DNA primase [Yersinia enterocolitica]ELI8237554.1 DNA primase [Yersinia enterocolitica]ELW7379042.1 DNA primase [Yersinia enterocolitica]
MGKKIKIQSFAHLWGGSAKATEETEDDKDKAKKAKGRQAEEDEQDPEAEENDDDSNDNPDDQDNKDPDAEDDSDDADADEGSDDDGDDDKEDRNVKKGRRAERDRCARIFGSKHATGRGDLAVSLALNSGMSSAAVIRVLASTAATAPASASRKRSLDERMQAYGNAQPGQDTAAASKGASLVNKMTSLYDSAKGKK